MLPDEQVLFNRILGIITDVYASYGYLPIETSAFERIETLSVKGDIKNEIYGVFRLQDPNDTDNRFALRFDHTVPLARYVANNFHELTFPFKRRAIGKVWRGERAMRGRFREFYQADIDVIDIDTLSLNFDAECASVIFDVFSKLDIGKFNIHLNNRKLVQGFLEAIDVPHDSVFEVMLVLDKLAKIGASETAILLTQQVKLPSSVADRCVEFCGSRADKEDMRNILKSLPVSKLLEEGKRELETVASLLRHIPHGFVDIDLSIMRGLDYYTGTVYECTLEAAPEVGSICSGGRYDDLASRFINKKLPGVGLSIGVSRLFHILMEKNLIKAPSKFEMDALIAILNSDQRIKAIELAHELRQRTLKIEVYADEAKLGKQIKYADKKRIPYVIFIEEDGYSAKNLHTGEQVVVSTIDQLASLLS